jgi:SAM-dependent methyltransferase
VADHHNAPVPSADASSQYGPLCSLVYQLDKPIGRSFGDVELYKELLAGLSGPILEPAVGTGRFLIPLLRSGFEVRGFDTSREMLAVCRDNCAEHGVDPVLFVADIVDFCEPGAFAAVVLPVGTFALVTGPGLAETALHNIRASLRPGGRFIVDVDVVPATGGPHAPRQWRHGDELITLTSHSKVDEQARVATLSGRYELSRDGEVLLTELETYRLRLYDRDEFTEMLRAAGFEAVSVHGDYTMGRDPATARLVWTFDATAG